MFADDPVVSIFSAYKDEEHELDQRVPELVDIEAPHVDSVETPNPPIESERIIVL